MRKNVCKENRSDGAVSRRNCTKIMKVMAQPNCVSEKHVMRMPERIVSTVLEKVASAAATALERNADEPFAFFRDLAMM